MKELYFDVLNLIVLLLILSLLGFFCLWGVFLAPHIDTFSCNSEFYIRIFLNRTLSSMYYTGDLFDRNLFRRLL